MNYQLLIISELAVIGMLLCSFGIGSAGWSKTESANSTEKSDYQTSIWRNYSCDSHKAPSATQSVSQAFIVMAILLCIIEALLSPLYMIIKKEKHVHILLIVISIGAFVNCALLVASVFTVGSSGYSTSTSSIFALLAALLNLIAGIMTLMVCAVRHFLKKAGALHEYMAMKILAIMGTDIVLVAAVIVLAICRQPSWIASDVGGADAFVHCVYEGNSFGDLNRVFTTIQALMMLAMLLSVITVVLMTIYHKVNVEETRSKIIRGVYITCLLGGIMLLIGLVVFGVQPGINITYSFFAAMFSAICSLAIGGTGVIRKLPSD